jgi:hypothetical protein
MFRLSLLAGVIAIASVGALAEGDEGRAVWRYVRCNEDATRELAGRDPKQSAPSREVLAFEAMARCKAKEDALAASHPADQLQELRSWVRRSNEKWIECIQMEQRDCGPSAFYRALAAYRHCNAGAAWEVVGNAVTARRSAPGDLLASEAITGRDSFLVVDVLASEVEAKCNAEEDALDTSYSGEQLQEFRSWKQKLREEAINEQKRFQEQGLTCAGASLCSSIRGRRGVRP